VSAAKGGGEAVSRNGSEPVRESWDRASGELGDREGDEPLGEWSADRNEASDARRCWAMSRGGSEGAPVEEACE